MEYKHRIADQMLAKKFGWVIQTEKKSGIEEAIESVIM